MAGDLSGRLCDVLVSFVSPWQNDKRNVCCHKISFRKRVINNIKFDAGRPLYGGPLTGAPPILCLFFGPYPGLSFWAFCGALNTCYFMILLGTQHATRKGGSSLLPRAGSPRGADGLTWRVENELHSMKWFVFTEKKLQ